MPFGSQCLLVEPTPLVNVEGVLAKIEWVHSTGSIKDRVARFILDRSAKLGLLRPGMRIVEASSGNTGIAFAFHGLRRGYPVTIVMPENMSAERIHAIRKIGAELILCSAEGSFAEAARIRDEMAAKDPMVFNPDQFGNPLNVECHRSGTGKEIVERTEGPIDAFVAGVGTGGTLIGVGQALRSAGNDLHLVAVEPTESAVLSGGGAGRHSIFGIGDGFIPAIAGDGRGGMSGEIDEVITVSSEEALAAAKYLHEQHRLGVGTSSGANFVAAKKLQRRFGTVATVFADGANKYLSCGLRECEPGECRFYELCQNSILPALAMS